MLDDTIKVDIKKALLGGGLSASVVFLGMWATGQASGASVDDLLASFIPASQAFTDTVVIASATILALMFTVLGMSASSESDLEEAHYIRIKQIALGDTTVFVVAMTMGLLLNVPLAESSKLNETLEWIIYYVALGTSALLGGALIAIVLMIYGAVKHMINVVALDGGEETTHEEQRDAEG